MDEIRLTVEDGIGLVLIDRREKKNAFSLRMWRALADLGEELAAKSEELAAVVIRGPGGGPFSAGADISEFAAVRSSEATAAVYDETVASAVGAIARLPVPTIALVEGACVGGGCELAAACDLRLASSSAVFGITPARLGIVYSLEATRRLVELVGASGAKYLLCSGEIIGAERALRMGLVNEVLAGDQLDGRLAELLGHFRENAKLSVRAAKTMVALALSPYVESEPEELAEQRRKAYASDEYRQRVAKFLGRRDGEERGQVK